MDSFSQGTYAHTARCATENGGTWSHQQIWVITQQLSTPWGVFNFTIRPWSAPGMCLDVKGGALGNDVPLWLWPCNGPPRADGRLDGGGAQVFRFATPPNEDQNTSPWQLIKRVQSGRCVDKSGTTILQYDCWGPWWQQWRADGTIVP